MSDNSIHGNPRKSVGKLYLKAPCAMRHVRHEMDRRFGPDRGYWRYFSARVCWDRQAGVAEATLGGIAFFDVKLQKLVFRPTLMINVLRLRCL